jgi:hypothetical protein
MFSRYLKKENGKLAIGLISVKGNVLESVLSAEVLRKLPRQRVLPD